ncbi:chromate transporter [Miniphocaeibacter halophilus]|uniref:Chromate transporter n=1 Tax=Miniphocaeibacter halophilus TaxID=2931922 RepID=A0AC61MUL4_9FIRM|nr:chromate transporter [Miniphocaeibacter halophilus]QQK07909.1 chromate transporter [Miniphocaeibacter halophilus]
MLYFQMFKTFFIIGAFTIGGGVAMIPIIENEVVEKKEWLTYEEFMEALTVAQGLPGVLAVNMSVYIGLKIKGYKGALLCMLGAVLPSFIMIIIVATFYEKIIGTDIVDRIFKGALPAVAAVIAASVYSLGKKSNFKYYHYIVAILIAIVVELFNISPILLILSFGIGYIIYNKFVLNSRKGD